MFVFVIKRTLNEDDFYSVWLKGIKGNNIIILISKVNGFILLVKVYVKETIFWSGFLRILWLSIIL